MPNNLNDILRKRITNRILKYSPIYLPSDLQDKELAELYTIQNTSFIKLLVKQTYKNRHRFASN